VVAADCSQRSLAASYRKPLPKNANVLSQRICTELRDISMFLDLRWPMSLMIGTAALAAAPALSLHRAEIGAVAPCASLAAVHLDQTFVERAEVVPAGTFTLPTAATQNTWAGVAEVSLDRLPVFCRVQLRLKPTPASDIGAEVWLPESGWNGKFVAVGNAGLGGR
jgi:feruloyl esterase